MRIVFLSNIPAPYQVKYSTELRKYFEIEFWFSSSNISGGRPNYWNIPLPEYCKVVPLKNNYKYFNTLKKELNDFNPDVVWLGGSWTKIYWFIAYNWARNKGKKIIVGPMERSHPNQKIFKRIIKKVFFKYIYRKIIIFLCPGYESYDYFKYILKRSNTYLFPYVADISECIKHPIRKINNNIIFAMGGRMIKHYRHKEILKIFEKICINYKNVRLVIAGEGEEKNTCENIVNSSELLKKKVSWRNINNWDDIATFYSECHIFIDYPTWAAWGIIIQETLASGMAIICGADRCASRYYIIDGFNGLRVTNEKEIYNAMEYYIQNPEMIEIHSERNKIIGKNESIEKRTKDFLEIINSLN